MPNSQRSNIIRLSHSGDAPADAPHPTGDGALPSCATLIHQNADAFGRIAQSTPQGIWTIDIDGRTTFVNERMAHLLGYTTADMMGKVHTDFMWEEDRPKGDEQLELRLQGINAVWDQRYRRKDGSELWTLAACNSLQDSEGRTVGALGMFTDITERKRAEHSLRSNEELYRTIVEQAAVSIAIAEPRVDGVVLHVNQTFEQLLGYEPGGLIGKTFQEVTHPDDRGINLDHVQSLLSGQVPSYTLEKRYLHRDGHGVWVKVMMALARHPDLTPRFFLASITDITERKRNEEMLRNVDRRKTAFLATLAHELRNPLAPVINAVHVLHRKCPDVPELKWARDVIERQVRTMSRLIDELMDISRIKQGKVNLSRERVALSTIIDAAVEMVRPAIDEMGHQLAILLPAEPVDLDADPTRLVQVVMNVLNNAAKYTDRGGSIKLDASVNGEELRLSVTDSGIGIPADKLQTIFEMFSQVDSALTRAQGGLGVGLSLVQRLVEMHGGSIEARSEGIGRGSEFLIRLPIVMKTVVSHLSNDGMAQDVTKRSAHSGIRVLVVDDNRDAAESLVMLLTMEGHSVRSAYEGKDAVEAARDFRPHVVLCDIGLPLMNGYEVAKVLRRERTHEMPRLIALTGFGQRLDQQLALEAGFDHHLTKPVDPNTIQELLSRHQAQFA